MDRARNRAALRKRQQEIQDKRQEACHTLQSYLKTKLDLTADSHREKNNQPGKRNVRRVEEKRKQDSPPALPALRDKTLDAAERIRMAERALD